MVREFSCFTISKIIFFIDKLIIKNQNISRKGAKPQREEFLLKIK
jgi:preprotein translocase subunit Sss1